MQKSRNISYLIHLILLDILLWGISVFTLMTWRIVADKHIITRYLISYSIFLLVWVLSGLLFRKYKPWKSFTSWRSYFILLATTLSTSLFCIFFHYFVYPDLSLYFLLLGILIVVLHNLIIIVLYYSYRFATFMDRETFYYEERSVQKVLKEPSLLDEDSYKNLQNIIVENSGNEVLGFLERNIPLRSTNTFVFDTRKVLNISVCPNYKFDCIINLSNLNNIIGINRFISVVNEKLPDNGLFICSFVTQDFYQKRILEKYPPVVNRIIYWWKVFFYRIVPKLFFFNRLYFQINEGKSRFVSKMEMFGRLYYCGFEVEKEEVIGSKTFVIARRRTIPQKDIHRRYGLIIKLPRIGKNGKIINVYKFRTMYPYSEFIQQYVFEKNNLSQGGKIKNDPRITSYGHFFRKMWIDELPMFINMLKGEMKLVGIRPLSKHYYSLYTKELQEMRIKFKPGLLPPFYADMPKTLDEIQTSEMKYLVECKEKGVFATDIKYFWKIFFNIVFKKARSK
ncbi:MAG: sugar transferase [Paludibacteraceae bacterium]|nr:sugar transferase [Paludibacteraceae bacterium]